MSLLCWGVAVGIWFVVLVLVDLLCWFRRLLWVVAVLVLDWLIVFGWGVGFLVDCLCFNSVVLVY